MVAKQQGIAPSSAAPNRALVALRIAAQIVAKAARRVGRRAVSSAPRPGANFDRARVASFDRAHVLKDGRHGAMRKTLRPAPSAVLPPVLDASRLGRPAKEADLRGPTSPSAGHVRLDLTATLQRVEAARAPIDSAAMIGAPPASFVRDRARNAGRSGSTKSAPVPRRVASRAKRGLRFVRQMSSLIAARALHRTARNAVRSRPAADPAQAPAAGPLLLALPENNARNLTAIGSRTPDHGRALTAIAQKARIALDWAHASGRSPRGVPLALPPDHVPAASIAEAPAVAGKARARTVAASVPVAAVVPAQNPAANPAEANAVPDP